MYSIQIILRQKIKIKLTIRGSVKPLLWYGVGISLIYKLT